MAERTSCPQCGDDNEPGQLFCGSCGARLLLPCAACGATNPPEFRFCGNCGSELAAPTQAEQSGEERRVVTVLFADLVGFTSRAERLDPEDVRAILTPYYRRLREEIEAYGGTVEKFIGDAVMGVFGAPVTYGDDPERAVRAALRVREAVGEMNEADPKLDLQVRIAVNTGEAIVALGARTWEGEAMVAGDVVNTAARLQAGAPVNAILAGEETYRCTRSTVEYAESDPVVAKGKEEPIPVWLALAAHRPPGERTDKGIPIVGREHELAALAGIWKRVAAERQTHLVTVLGAPGLGKTRLAAEFAALAAEEGGQVIRGRSMPYGESGPYGAFAQQVKQLAGIFDSDAPELAVEKLHRHVAALGDSEDSDEMSAHIGMLIGLGAGEVPDRHRLFYSARRHTEALASRGPTVLLFEDVHWADPSLLDLLELLSSRIQDAPLLILTLARPDLLDLRPSWGSRIPSFTALRLEPLGEEHARELAARLLARGDITVEDDEAARVAEAAEGNPLFLEELAASVSEHAAPDGELPTSIRAIVAARLDALPPLERSVLLDAAVLGKVFWADAVARLGSYGERLPELLDSLEQRDLVRREAVSRIQGHEQFRFKHMLIRDAAYATLPRARRREAHAAVATFLTETNVRSESAAALGHHWREAGEVDRAIEYLVDAAEQASRGWAKKEAVQLYNEALALLPADDQKRRHEIRLRCAVAQAMVYHVRDVESLALGPEEPSGG
jgi:class 3 adenylate cyclase